jgi:hypothetical protein
MKNNKAQIKKVLLQPPTSRYDVSKQQRKRFHAEYGMNRNLILFINVKKLNNIFKMITLHMR